MVVHGSVIGRTLDKVPSRTAEFNELLAELEDEIQTARGRIHDENESKTELDDEKKGRQDVE